MGSFDLIPFPADLKTLFVLESPHTQELESGYPCTGDTGLNMTVRIFPGESIPFGRLLAEKKEIIKEYGVFNSCSFPLGLKDRLNENEKKIALIKEIKWMGQRIEQYKLLNSFLNGFTDLDDQIQYSERLKNILTCSPSIKNLVVCGMIAQALFLYIHKIKILSYNKLISQTILGFKINVLFVNHPSGKNSQWHFDPNILNTA